MVEPLTPAEIQSINTALAGLPKGKLRYKRAQREEFFRLRGTDLSNEDIAALKEQFESDETGIDASQRDETALLQEVRRSGLHRHQPTGGGEGPQHAEPDHLLRHQLRETPGVAAGVRV